MTDSYNVTISRVRDGHVQAIAAGSWEPGNDPQLKGEDIPAAIVSALLAEVSLDAGAVPATGGTWTIPEGEFLYRLDLVPKSD